MKSWHLQIQESLAKLERFNEDLENLRDANSRVPPLERTDSVGPHQRELLLRLNDILERFDAL